MPAVAVVIPWRESDPHRARALNWVLDRYRDRHPHWEIHLAEGGDPWRKALPVMAAADQVTADIVLVADADVWVDGLGVAIAAVEAGAPWAVPHTLVHRLTATATDHLLAGDSPGANYEQRPYRGVLGGGLVALPRTTLQAIPLDPRFEGWGQEDDSWSIALQTLLGPPWRGTADLIHLWHPPQQRLSRVRGSTQSWQLRRRYVQARRDPDLMRALLEEAHRDLRSAQHALHDRQPQPLR